MRKCYGCKNKGVHRWGKYWLCDRCHKEAMITHKDKTKNANIKILEKSKFGCGGGYYEWETGEIYICNSDMGFPLEVVLHHEVMHRILNICINPQASYNYDNISSNGEIDKFALCNKG